MSNLRKIFRDQFLMLKIFKRISNKNIDENMAIKVEKFDGLKMLGEQFKVFHNSGLRNAEKKTFQKRKSRFFPCKKVFDL